MATQITNNSIKVANPEVDGNPRAYITQDSSVGATSLAITSTSGFPTTGNFYILVGDYGDEKSEVIRVTTVSGKTLTVDALANSHEASEPITKILYNQIRFYGMNSEDEAPGTNTLATSNIDATAQYTEYIYTGSTYDYFATAYYNSDGDQISGYSETVRGASFTRRSTERIIRSAALKALTQIDDNPGSRLTMDNAITILQDGLDEISARKKRWPFWNTMSTGTTTATGINYIAKPTDLTQLVSIKVDGHKLDWFTKNDYNRYTEGTTSTGKPTHYTEKNGKYYLFPTPNSEYDITYEYYKVPDVISNMSTEIDIPFVPVLIYYCGSQFAYIRGNEKKGDSLYQMYVRLLEGQVEEYGGPEQDGVSEYVERTSILNYED